MSQRHGPWIASVAGAAVDDVARTIRPAKTEQITAIEFRTSARRARRASRLRGPRGARTRVDSDWQGDTRVGLTPPPRPAAHVDAKTSRCTMGSRMVSGRIARSARRSFGDQPQVTESAVSATSPHSTSGFPPSPRTIVEFRRNPANFGTQMCNVGRVLPTLEDLGDASRTTRPIDTARRVRST